MDMETIAGTIQKDAELRGKNKLLICVNKGGEAAYGTHYIWRNS